MKKISLILTIVLFSLTTFVVLAKSSEFSNALRNCSSYSSDDTVNILNTNVQSHKTISGWEGDKCIYRENINFMNIESNVVCKLSKSQINELVSVIDEFERSNEYSNQPLDLSSFDTAQSNPVSIVWNKFLQDPNTCSMTTNQQQ